MANTGKKLEDYAQYVYSQLLKLSDFENTLVSKRVTIKGQSGATNEFDVYYQFSHLNIDCRVAIECKDWKSKVSVKEIRDFATKLSDVGLGNIIGIMISKVGFQEGTKTFADSYGIKLMTEDELPTIADIVSGVFKKGFLPDEKIQGEPFWTLMEIQNGDVTGSYCTVAPNHIPLFYSQNMARFFLNLRSDKDKLAVRGISQYQLRGLLNLAESHNQKFVLFPIPFSIIADLSSCYTVVAEPYTIKEDFLKE
ncbi:restriction endonuclease [Streptococcus pluranimalium]|uniref:restriction endonuclease n=1 Tax=Streptococcus pluranimalium TaxID=82348 RepID=UPI003F68CF91